MINMQGANVQMSTTLSHGRLSNQSMTSEQIEEAELEDELDAIRERMLMN